MLKYGFDLGIGRPNISKQRVGVSDQICCIFEAIEKTDEFIDDTKLDK